MSTSCSEISIKAYQAICMQWPCNPRTIKSDKFLFTLADVLIQLPCRSSFILEKLNDSSFYTHAYHDGECLMMWETFGRMLGSSLVTTIPLFSFGRHGRLFHSLDIRLLVWRQSPKCTPWCCQEQSSLSMCLNFNDLPKIVSLPKTTKEPPFSQETHRRFESLNGN